MKLTLINLIKFWPIQDVYIQNFSKYHPLLFWWSELRDLFTSRSIGGGWRKTESVGIWHRMVAALSYWWCTLLTHEIWWLWNMMMMKYDDHEIWWSWNVITIWIQMLYHCDEFWQVNERTSISFWHSIRIEFYGSDLQTVRGWEEWRIGEDRISKCGMCRDNPRSEIDRSKRWEDVLQLIKIYYWVLI